MFAKRMLVALCLVGFISSASLAMTPLGIETEDEATICATGATEAIARQNAIDALNDAIEDFEDTLPPEDYVIGALQSPGVWDGTEYCITYKIVWMDNP